MIAFPQNQLHADFKFISTTRICSAFKENNLLYAPTYLTLLEDLKRGGSYILKRRRTVARAGSYGPPSIDAELESEKAWIKAREEDPEPAAVPEVDALVEPDEEDGIECGCCFSASAFVSFTSFLHPSITHLRNLIFHTYARFQDQLIQCPEAHLFCKSCMISYASNLLGSHNPNIVCMDQSGCKLPFPESELQRFLTPKLLALYERVKQRKEIEAAGLENLEECPFCEYKVVIDNPQERLIRCENEECGAVTCRECKKLVSI